MHKANTPTAGSFELRSGYHKTEGCLHSARRRQTFANSLISNEALDVFNEVQKNRQKILKKGSENTFYAKTTVKTLKLDASGTKIIEKLESTAIGGFNPGGERVGEVTQAYRNSQTGLEKVSLQRILGNRLRKTEVKKAADRYSKHEISENAESDFDQEWRINAKTLGVRSVIGFERKVVGLSPHNDL